MSCTITLNIGSNKITLDGIEEDSIQSFYDYSNLIQEINKQGKTEEFINAIRAQGINNTSIYVNKDMEGLTDSKQFFLPNMTYREFRNKFPTAPELENINVLYVDEIKTNGTDTPLVYSTKDVQGNDLYIVQRGGEKQFINYLNKLKTIQNNDIPSNFINFIQELEQSDEAWLRKFSSYSFTKSSSKKARGEYEGSIKTAREVLTKYLQNPESFYEYLLSGKNANFKQNVERIRKIKEALNSLNDYDPPREYGTPFANALMMHTSYKKFNEITYRAVTLQQLKTLTKQASPELYEKYFSKDNPDPSAIQIKVNSVLRQLFWNTDGQENLSTKGIQIEAIYNGNIYFNIQPSTFETKYGYTIASKEAYPHQEQEYKGYNIYSAVINGTTKFMVARGVFTDQNVGKTYDSLQQARDFIDKSFKEDILKKGLLLDLYMPNEHGVQFSLSTHNSTILPGQVIRAINVQINSKAFTKEIQNYNAEQGLKFIQKHNDTVDTTQLDSLEKILLTAAKVQEGIDKGIQEDLTEFVDNLNNYNYYYVNNVDQSQGLQYTIQLQQIPNVRSTTSSPIGWISMPQRLTYFANKIESRFGIPTQVLNKQAISEKYGAKFPNKDISKEKAFIIDNTIVINLELATKQDVAHEYMHVFMGIVKSQPDLQEDYFDLLQDLVENTEQGQQQLQEYQNVSEYSDLARIDLYEEVAANIMGEYLTSLNPNTYPKIFRDFRKFIQNNTFNQDLKENILDFTDFAVNSSYKINTNSTERQITNFLKTALQNNIIQEICQ